MRRRLLREFVGIFDVIVSYPGGWEVPQALREAIIDERLEHYKDENITATDAEAAAYLSTASLCFPLGHDWAEIYIYVAEKTMARRGVRFPEDLHKPALSSYHCGLLEKLKRDIYNSRVKHRRKR